MLILHVFEQRKTSSRPGPTVSKRNDPMKLQRRWTPPPLKDGDVAMSKSIWLALLFICLPTASVYAQANTDSLESRLALSSRAKIEDLVELGEALQNDDPAQAIAYAYEALALLKTVPDAGLEVDVLSGKSHAHYTAGQYDSVLVYAERTREIAQATGNTKGLADAAYLKGGLIGDAATTTRRLAFLAALWRSTKRSWINKAPGMRFVI